MALAEQVRRMNAKWRRRARGYWITTCLSCAALMAFFVFGTARGGWEFLLNGIVMLTWGLSIAGAAAIEGPFLVHKGLLVAPARPATVWLEPEFFVLLDESDELRVPRVVVRGATFVFHDSFDGIRGIDDALRIHIADCADLLVASSTNGFHDLITWLDRGGRLVREGVGCGSV